MFSRTVSLLLIAAVVACPFQCGRGLLGCCAAELPALQTSAVEDSACCCRHVESPVRHDDHSSDSPAHPTESCQGVCGGAVVEKPVAMSDVEDVVFLPTLDLDRAWVLRRSEWQFRLVVPLRHGKGNSGRMLRTLHMSFLC